MSYSSASPTVLQQSQTDVHARLPTNGPSQGLNDASRQTPRCLNVLFWNAGGLSSSKYSELKIFILDHDIDIFIVTEAGVASDNVQFYQLSGFTIHTLPRGRQVASGMIIGITNNIASNFDIIHQMSAEDKLEAIKIDAWLNKNHFRIIGVYNPPNNMFDRLLLEQIITNRTIVIGDFNAPSTRWGYQRTTSVGSSVETFIDNCSLNPIDTGPTFLSFSGQLSRPDLVMPHANLFDRCQHKLLDDPSGCGHRIVIASVEPMIKVPKQRPLTRWNFRKAKWQAYADETDALLTEEILSPNPQLTFSKITDAILSAATKHIPRGQVKKYSPFWTTKLTYLKSNRNKARKTAERTGNLTDCVQLRKAQATLQKEIVQSKRDTFHNFVAKLDYRKDGTKAHRFISKLNNTYKQPKVSPMQKGSTTVTCKKEIAKLFCKEFSSCSSSFPHRRRIRPPALPQPEADHHDLNDNFNLRELKSAIALLKTGKSCGPDEIFPEFITHLGKSALRVLLAAVNQTWHQGIPNSWKKAEIIPVLKKGKDPCLSKSYRPISLTSILCKVVERMVNNRLLLFIDRHRLIEPEQAGFRKHMSVIDQIIKLSQYVKDGFQRKMSTLACFVDFKGAYDTISRNILLSKLANLKVNGNMLKWLTSFLCQRLVRVKYNDTSSAYRQQKRGLPQGAVLSCVLFNIMINDLITELKRQPGTEVLCYADDLTIWSTSSSIPAMEQNLNDALQRLNSWCLENDMIVSREKTTAQLFSMSTKKHDINLLYDSTPLEILPTTKYLGMTLDSKLNCSQRVSNVVDKSTNRLCILKRLAGTQWGATQDVLATTYKSYIRPVLEYGAEALTTASDSTKKKLSTVPIMRYELYAEQLYPPLYLPWKFRHK